MTSNWPLAGWLALSLLLPARVCATSPQGILVHLDGTPEIVADWPPRHSATRSTVHHAWVWSKHSAPRRLAANEIDTAALPAARGRLLVTVSPGVQRAPLKLRLLAAPLAMWADVPEPLLPTIPLHGHRAEITINTAERWRVRVVGTGFGSEWVDVAAGRPVLGLALRAAADRQLEILSSAGQPLPDAVLTIFGATRGQPPGDPVAIYRANQDGRIMISALPEGRELYFVVTESLHAPIALAGRIDRLPARITLPSGATVRGRFADSRGLPVGSVTITSEALVLEGMPLVSRQRAVSAQDGGWEIAGLPARSVVLLAVADGLAPLRKEVELEEGANDLGTLTLWPGVLLPVTVTDDTGAPVAGASLSAGVAIKAHTDHSGRAVLSGLPSFEPLSLVARSKGHLEAASRLLPPLPRDLTLVLRRAFVVTGSFVGSDDNPASEGRARVVRGRTYSDHPLLPSGRFELELDPGVALTLVLSAPDTGELRVQIEPGLPGEVRDLGVLRAPNGVRVVGRLLHAITGEPVAGGRIWVPRASEHGDIAAWVHQDLVVATSTEDGTFQLRGLPSRPAVLRIEAPGLARLHRAVSPAPGEVEVDLGELLLSSGSTLQIRAHDDAGEGALARVDLRNHWLELDMLTAVVRDREAIIENVPPGRVTVTVLQGRDLLCEMTANVPASGDDVLVDCGDDRMRVAGTVTVGDRRVREGQLTWIPREEETSAVIMNRQTPLGIRQQQVFGAGRPQVDVGVDARGTFESDRLRPGRWDVIWIPRAGSLGDAERVELPDVDEYEIALVFSGLSVSGRVVDRDGDSVPGARVRVLDGEAFAWSDSDGSFVLEGLSPGAHRIQARHDERTSRVVTATLEQGGESDPVLLTLQDHSDDRLDVQVLDERAIPVSGAFVFVQTDQSSPRFRMLTADIDGKAAVVLEPPGPWRVRAAAVANGRWAFGAWAVVEEAAEGLGLATSVSGSLRIISRTAEGSPSILAPGAWDLSRLVSTTGVRPFVTPDAPLEIFGLPEGLYEVALGEVRRLVEVRKGSAAQVELP